MPYCPTSHAQPTDHSVAVILPAYNESAHIGDVLATIPEWVDQIVVVDDASTDDTAGVVQSASDARVTLVRHETNSGVGAAMVTGYRTALQLDADIIVKMDADGQMDPADLERLVRPLVTGLGDYAKGNRFYFRNATTGMPRIRGFGNSLLSVLTKVASGYWHVFDSQCGYTAVRSSFLRLLDLDEHAKGYFFENDMLIRLNALNARVIDVPVATLYGSETSHVNVGHVALTFPGRLALSGIKRFWRKHLLTDFGAVAVLAIAGNTMALFGLTFGAYHWWLSMVSGRPATTGTVMMAVVPLIVGFQMLLQALVLSVTRSPGAPETAEYVRSLIEEGAFQ